MTNHTLSKKPLFNLSKVLQETGIKADTLRAWERRYQLPTPSRSEGGHRLFSAYDIETIKWLLARQNEGMRISQAVDYWRELIAAGTDPLAVPAENSPGLAMPPARETNRQSLTTLTRLWIDHALNFDGEKAEQALDAAFAQFPWEVVCTNMIFRGLSEIGERWYSNEITVQQEHFASQSVIQKLNALINNAPAPYHPQKILISLPPGEHHTIAPLILNTLLRYRGWETTYLGANVPDDHILEAFTVIQPIVIIMTAARLQTAATLLETSRIIQEKGIPLAFGGNIFHLIPDLAKVIPGTYLGTDFGQAVSQIEYLLCEPEPKLTPVADPNPYQDLLIELDNKLPYLENQTLLALRDDDTPAFPTEILQDINNFLIGDILAALTLGDINHLRHNIDWVEGLVRSRSYAYQDFKAFLETFISIIKKELSPHAQPLWGWLDSYLEKLA